ncbi:hypothetical protein BC829DRAFT_390000 [Chytridium lagenaria]|nr:hypothetical protein BC829DRAFT_390000 [Chytridium lagenaria]
MLAFISLLLIQIIAAKFKIRYQCHPLESVGGLVWTLRKVDPGVARDVQGLKLSELLDYSSRLKLERKSGDGSTVIRRMTVAEINERSGTAPRSASRSSALVFEPPPFDEGRDHFMIPGFGQGGVGANGRNGIHVGRDTYVASPQTYSPNRTGYTELRESISIDDDHSRLPAARPT